MQINSVQICLYQRASEAHSFRKNPNIISLCVEFSREPERTIEFLFRHDMKITPPTGYSF